VKYYHLLWVQLPRFRERALWAFIIILIGTILHFMPDVESAVFRAINGIHTDWLDTLMLPLTYCGDGVVITVFIIALGCTIGWKEAIKAALIVITASIAVQLIKNFYDAPRPVILIKQLHTLGPIFKHGSFPSGHMTSIVALATYMGQRVYNLKWEAWALVVLVGLSRIYCGMHFLGDVIFGAGLGYLIAVIYLRKEYIWPAM
jgi:membrane-associated phospholipid phosphatase